MENKNQILWEEKRIIVKYQTSFECIIPSVLPANVVHTSRWLKCIIIRCSIVIFILALRHHVLLIIITGMIVITRMNASLPRHFRRRHRTINTRYRYQHSLQRIRIQTHSILSSILNSHIIRTFTLRLSRMIIIHNTKYIAILHLELCIVRRFRMMQLLPTK